MLSKRLKLRVHGHMLVLVLIVTFMVECMEVNEFSHLPLPLDIFRS